jgi:GNAT superfamily N-acetyltransferase
VILRQGTAADRDALIALQWRASLAGPAHRDLLLAHPDAIDIPDEHLLPGRALVCEIGGSLAGFAIVLSRADGEAELDGLFVDPPLWRQGIGTRLVAGAAGRARAMGAGALLVVSGPAAEGFYVRLGFTVVEDFPTRFEMAKLLRLDL